MLNLLPNENELKEFTLKSDPEYYKGDDLFYLINGGADLYLEYGFKDVISASYENTTGLSFKIEIYQMLNDSAAYGIFSFNRGDKNISDQIGDAFIQQNDFLIFIKGNYYSVLTTNANKEEQKVDLWRIAKILNAKMSVSGKLPSLVTAYDTIAPHSIYLNGSIALSNIYLFDYTDIFHFSDGLFFKDNDASVFIFNYPSPEVCENTFQEVQNRLQTSTRFNEFEITEKGFSLINKKEQFLIFRSLESKIYVFMGKDKTNIENKMQSILQ